MRQGIFVTTLGLALAVTAIVAGASTSNGIAQPAPSSSPPASPIASATGIVPRSH